MSDFATDEIFTDGQARIAASNMNGIISRAKALPELIANKPESVTLNVADYLLVLKADNSLAKAKFSTIVNSTGSSLPLASTTANGMLKQVSGVASDYVGGDNVCHPVTNIIPTGTVWDYLGATAPAGWFLMQGQAVSRTGTGAALFALIGTTYGTGDGSTTYNLPDTRGRNTIGSGTGAGLTARTLGAKIGAETKIIAVANMPSHAHSITDVAHIHGTVAHTHVDNGHQHSIPNVFGQVFGAQAGGGTTYIANGTTTTGVAFADLRTAAPNTGSQFTGINATLAAGSGTALDVMNPALVTNKIVKA